MDSESRFRSEDLWVMSPTRFRCANSLIEALFKIHSRSEKTYYCHRKEKRTFPSRDSNPGRVGENHVS